MRHVGSAIGAALLLSAFGTAAHAASFLNIIDPANPTFTQALGINGSGTIVGYGNATNFDGFVLTLPSSFTRENFPNPSPPPTTLFTQVIGIDAAGDTVGFYVTNPTTGNTSGFFKPWPAAPLPQSISQARCSISCSESTRTGMRQPATPRSPMPLG